MTAISRLLKQRSALCRRALEQTYDVNEAYLVVHGVMARALKCDEEPEHDLGPAMASALQLRSRRMAMTS